MRFFAFIFATVLYAMYIGVVLFFFGIVLPLFTLGCTIYKIPFVIREQLKFRQKIKEIIDAD